MAPAPVPANEAERLAALLSCNVLETPAEAGFDDLTMLASRLCDAPIALISLLDESRQWFKSRVGIDASETPRDHAFCGYAILQDEPLIINDAAADPRTRDNPLVTGEPGIRFYAGVPLVVDSNIALGTLCVIDTTPRTITEEQITLLRALARQAASQLRLRQTAAALEEARVVANRANQAKSAFLAHMSHEVRTPLTSIVGYTDLLHETTSGSDDRAETVDAIARNAQHLLAVVNDILDISKIEAGMMSIDRASVDPVAVLAEVADLARSRASAKSLSFEIDFQSSIPASIETDPLRLRQILLNLVYNAIKFTDRGGVTIAVSADPVSHTLTLAVHDTGPGMTPTQLETISRFEAFRQADGGTARRFGGTGLGLRISHILATMLDGGISIDSTPGEGSTFTLALEIQDGWNETAARSAADAQAALDPAVRQVGSEPRTPTASLDGLNILLVEDSMDNQRLLAHHLRRTGAQVVLASDGAQALSLIDGGTGNDTRRFDVVLMDVEMPGMDGFQATEHLRRMGYDRPIIILTAHAMSDSREQGMRAGGDDYLTKPINPARLVNACLSWAGQASPTRRPA